MLVDVAPDPQELDVRIADPAGRGGEAVGPSEGVERGAGAVRLDREARDEGQHGAREYRPRDPVEVNPGA
ncbi:hypothetical protein GCM10023147_13230 [Tsukamurella soli]|uniref:Uncharacterized protein n=1 Tax=Tsukamurella soli TaxID=644556 RepID=A0ABP8JB23_9ACTN